VVINIKVPYYQDEAVTIYLGDCVEVMADMPENSVDAIVTDPPYGLEFMGKEWDKFGGRPVGDGYEGNGGMKRYFKGNKPVYEAGLSYQTWTTQWATQALRVLKPGGYLLAFGGTRTYHRLVCGLEDAGFEIRDTICWLYGSGFPKNLDISKQIDKMAGAEREVLGQGKYANKGRRIDNRVYSKATPSDQEVITTPSTEAAKEWQGWGTALKPAFEPIVVARKPISEKNVALNVLKWGTGGMDIDGARIGKENHIVHGKQAGHFQPGSGETIKDYHQVQGRWPANVILDEEAARVLDEQSGESETKRIEKPSDCRGNTWGGTIQTHRGPRGHTDSGGASRFFYCAKASSSERGKGNVHPTCKPVKLMEYLVKLVSREGATILDPFAGSMSTVLAAVALGRECIAIEQSEDYCEILRNRCRQMAMDLR